MLQIYIAVILNLPDSGTGQLYFVRLLAVYILNLCARELNCASLKNVVIIIDLKKCAHNGRTHPNIGCPVRKMCTLGAECTLNFEHCYKVYIAVHHVYITVL